MEKSDEQPSDRPGRGSDKFPLRFPDGLRDRIKAAAASNNRTMNAEIISRLERYPSLGGEVDAIETVARAMAEAIDETVGEDPDFLLDKIGSVFSAVAEDGEVDTGRIHREWFAEVFRRLEGALAGSFHISDDLLKRVWAKAEKNMRSAEAEIKATLEREYPPATDVMHIHLANIREALARYERATDPQERLRLQTLVEMLAGAGHGMEIDWDEDGEL
ncbi:MAG: Arc family DNA-binding protein [Devosia sp.]